MNRPNFFIVGVAKCGTTALFDYLAQHPNTWCPTEKEPNYLAFDYPALQGPRTEEDYLALFAGAAEEHTAIGEASILYFFSQVAIEEIRARYPDARLIIMIRTPADMVYSFHSQLMSTANEDVADFAEAWRLQDERLAGRHIPSRCLVPEFLQYRQIGRMSRGIRRVLDVFPRDQVRLIVFDDLKSNPQGVLDEVTDYLELPRYDGVDFRVVNANRVQKSRLVTGVTTRPLRPGLQGFVRGLKRFTGLQNFSIRSLLARLNTREAPRKKLAPEFRQELRDYFADEVAELEALTGRDLSHWRD
ncbi:MAG: hypothetical protein HKN56_03610 [Gammaproteobacteria bacterium]|nr:sulfotransferase domain-containing protein [Gammaproteobacteria bacterium]NND54044.1 hypothetical protein [Gammaproteobacteria bacterium]